MPYIWLEEDELQAMRAALDWRRRVGQPLDWAAYDRCKARLVAGATHEVLPAPASRSAEVAGAPETASRYRALV